MDKRLIAAASVLVGAVGLAGLSAAATTSPGADPAQQPVRAKLGKAAPAAENVERPTQGGIVTSRPADPGAAGSYWTPERMQNAKPMERNVPNVSPPRSTPEPSGSGTGSTPKVAPGAVPKPKPKRQTTTPSPGIVSQPATGDAGSYWTQDRMDAAQPRGKGVPNSGSAPSGSSGSDDDGEEIVVTAP